LGTNFPGKKGDCLASLGWKLGAWKAKYRLSLQKLSADEQELAALVAKRLRQETQAKEVGPQDQAEKLVEKTLGLECEEQGIELDSDQHSYLSRAIFLQTYGFGFLQEMLSDDSLEEIAMVGLKRPVYVYKKNSGWKKTNVSIESQEYFVSLVNRLGRGLGRRLTAQQPRLNAVLEEGSRLHASMPPVSSCEFTIRKFGRQPISPFDLLRFGTYNAKAMALLSLAIQADMSAVFAGNTASGKTSTLNALLCFVPESERMLLIEETPEIRISHSHQLRLLPFEESGIGMVDLVRDSLRMRPDRVVVGEIRTASEAKAFVESALSGQAKGCYTTFHAQSSRDALLRMRMMGCLEADLEGIELFVVQRRVSTYDSKKRKVGELRKLTQIAVSNPRQILQPAIVYDGKSFSKSIGTLIEKISAGTGMHKNEVKKEIAKRERFLLSKKKVHGFDKSFSEIQKFLYRGKS